MRVRCCWIKPVGVLHGRAAGGQWTCAVNPLIFCEGIEAHCRGRYTELISSRDQPTMTQEEIAQYSPCIDRERLDYMEHQRELFDAAKPGLIEQYLDEYVAFEDGQVLDHDADRQHLAVRIYAKYGYRDLLMRRVNLEERVYSVGGFRTMRI
jgi:hypothetical protein